MRQGKAPTVFLHVDLDAFYASVEQLDNPGLKGKAVIVGARPGSRGVVSSCSYEARSHGVHSAMPISQAQRKCPRGIFLPVRMERYLEASQEVMAILSSYTPEFHQLSIDEASLDLSGTERLYGPPLEAARAIKEHVRRETGLTLSIGVAPNKYLAKLASSACKPDGLLLVQAGEEPAFLDRLQLKHLWGVGEKTLERLRELNIATLQALRGMPRDILCAMMGEACGLYLHKACRGLDPGIYPEKPKSRSLSSEVTFEEDKKDLEALKKCLLELAQQLMYRLIRGGWRANTLFLKLRTWDFTTLSVQKTIKHWLTSSDEIFQLGLSLLQARWDGATPIRLLGLGAANLEDAAVPVQGELFEDPFQKKRKVEEAVTRLREKIAGVSLTKASLLKKKP